MARRWHASVGTVLATLALMFLALYIAVALVLVNASGKSMLPMGGPMLGPNAGGSAPAGH